ncbi:MAG: M20 family metallopeptidase [Rickettsiales bacterium]|nr:MAG: M20 family metallopeptidase [Rickettsiales bacterium]
MTDLKNKIFSNIEKNENEIIENRRYFHKNPELSRQEFKTQEKIIELLKSYGIESKKIADTGVIADIKGAKDGKIIAIRADMDALCMNEEIDKPYKSQNAGVSHSCGHDAHVAGLLGIAKAFAENKDELTGSIRLLFQPDEEELGGADRMIKEGCLKGVSNVIGHHVWQPVSFGKISVCEEMMAAVGHFDVNIFGKGTHGSQPQNGINALNVACQAVLAINTITSCRIDPREKVVASIGTLISGEGAANVIPEKAIFKGTVRAFSTEILDNFATELKKIVKGICDSNGATCEVSYANIYPALINDKNLVKMAEDTIKEVLGNDALEPMLSNLGGEDFSYFCKEVPSVFLFTGVGNNTNAIYPHHNPKFDIEESGIINGAKVLSALAIKLLNQ